MSPFQKQVLEAVLQEHKEGREPTIDSISWKVNRTTASVKLAMAGVIETLDDPKKALIVLSASLREPRNKGASSNG